MRRPGSWRRVVAAQESGLVLVIALVMLALTLLGGDKAKLIRVEVPAGAEVTRDPEFFKVTTPVATIWYGRETGWKRGDAGVKGWPGGFIREERGTRVETTLDIREGADVRETDGVITVTVSGETERYETAKGWRVVTDDSGSRKLVREIQATVVAGSLPVAGSTNVATRNGQTVLKTLSQQIWLPERTGWRFIEESDDVRYLIGSVVVNKFFDKENLVLLTTRASYFAVMAVGMTAIIVLAGIDLSVGSIYAVSAIIGAMALQKLSPDASAWVSVPVGLAVSCAVGAALGAANGAMIVGLRIHPFIITLGTMAVYRGVAVLLTGGVTVSGLPESIQRGFFKAAYAGVYPTLTVVMVIVGVIGAFVLRSTVLGRRIYAIGGNETAAYYAGIPVGRVKLIVYTLGGLLAGLSACMEVGYNATASVGAGQGYELNVIAAAVIGGASLSGGRGSALGAVLGAILVSLIDNAMVILGIPQDYNQIVMGAAIVIAVAVDQLKRRYLKG